MVLYENTHSLCDEILSLLSFLFLIIYINKLNNSIYRKSAQSVSYQPNKHKKRICMKIQLKTLPTRLNLVNKTSYKKKKEKKREQ